MKNQSRNLLSFRWIAQKKQYGFTLVEMMVVMAIIAILASMGVMGYQGYMRGARDAQRIADMATLDTIVLDYRRSTGKYPSIENFTSIVMTANDGQAIVDPLDTAVTCFTAQANTAPDYCSYQYYTCDNGEGYVLSAKFETSYNAQKYTQISNESSWYYNTGRCTALDLPPATSVLAPDSCRTKEDCETNSVCVGPPPRHCRPKTNNGVGASCDADIECASNKCKKKVCEA